MKSYFPGSLRRRLTLLNSIVLIIILIASYLLCFFVIRTWLYQQTDSRLALIANQVSEDIRHTNQSITYSDQLGEADLLKQHEFIRIIDTKGTIIAHFGYLKALTKDTSAALVYPQKGVYQEITPINDDEAFRVFTLPVIQNEKIVGFVQAGQSIEIVLNIMEMLIIIFLFMIPLLLIVTLFFSRWVSNTTILPLVEIADTAEEITSKHLDRRLSIKGDDEIARLANSLDKMLERLQFSFENNRQFTGDVSHELRTPLTIIKGEISLALQRQRDAVYYKQVLEETEGEVDRLIKLTERLLLLARVEDGKTQIQISHFTIGETIQPLLKQMALLSEAKNQELTWLLPNAGAPAATTDKEMFLQIIVNLLDNAIRYTPNGGRIFLKIETLNNKTSLMIQDNGKGIPQPQIEKIFERYYRADQETTDKAKGSGLGLSIVKKLIDAMSGNLQIESIPDQGTTVKVDIPNV